MEAASFFEVREKDIADSLAEGNAINKWQITDVRWHIAIYWLLRPSTCNLPSKH